MEDTVNGSTPTTVEDEGVSSSSETKRRPPLYLAIDTEYQSNHTAHTNMCLSYQYCFYDISSNDTLLGILYPDISRSQRLSLSELIHKVLEIAKFPISDLENRELVVITHFFTAEWAMLTDRTELHMKFDFIRKTMVTSTRALKSTIIDENGEKVSFEVTFRDTMLLLPESYQSLEKASTFLPDLPKISISNYDKSHMLELLHKNRDLFAKYALRDVEVTMSLFIKLQTILNKINGGKWRLFSTLASATTNHYKKRMIKLNDTVSFEEQYSRRGALYLKYESLANRAYLGGLNSSYRIGELTGYTCIDIDFKNAYPTAMNLLKFAKFGDQVLKSKPVKDDTEKQLENL